MSDGLTGTTPADPDAAAWERALLEAVLGLPDGGSVVVTAPPVHRRLARGGGRGLRLLVPGRKVPVLPAAVLTRTEDHLRGSWSGAEQHGGPFPWSSEEVDVILGLGWHRPSAGDGPDFIRFWPDDVPQGPYLPADEAHRAVAVVARTFRDLLPTPDGAPVELPQIRTGDA